MIQTRPRKLQFALGENLSLTLDTRPANVCIATEENTPFWNNFMLLRTRTTEHHRKPNTHMLADKIITIILKSENISWNKIVIHASYYHDELY